MKFLHPPSFLGRKRALATLLALGFITIPTWAAPAPLLCFEFNEATEDGATDSGSSHLDAVLKPARENPVPLHSPDGEGVTGRPGDRALDLRSATGMGSQGTGGVVVVSHPPLDNLKSFTIVGWYKSVDAAGHGARLVDFTSGTGGILVGLNNSVLGLQVNEKGWNTGALQVSQPGIWNFFAVTYDSTSNTDNVVFYSALAGGEVAKESRTAKDPVPVGTNSVGILGIGNSPGGQRPLQGLIDKIAIYGSDKDGSGALKMEEIQKLFADAATR